MVTERDQIEAVRQILIQIYQLHENGLAGNRIGRVEREAIFFLYEGIDKYSLEKPHSKVARTVRRSNPGKLPPKSITYDHAIPLASLRDGLKLASKSHETMASFLRKHIRGVVIACDEDVRLNKAGLRRRLPEGAAPHDLLARYKAVGIGFEPEDEARLLEVSGASSH